MKVIKSDNVIYFDIDNTLVMWNSPLEVRNKAVKFDNYGWNEHLVPNYKMIDSLKRNSEKGAYIVVWSQNGYKWALEVVRQLGLTSFVDMVQSKPNLIFDDIAPQEFIKRAYINPDYHDERYKEKQ